MQFTTPVDIPANLPAITHRDELMVMGSCFSEHIGRRLADAKFTCDINPFGILYNPRSIYIALRQIIEKKRYTDRDVLFFGEQYHSYMHHGTFSCGDRAETLQGINHRIEKARQSLSRISYLFITFGTSWVYTLKETGDVVSNCHKMPARLFERHRLTIEEIVSDYSNLINDIRQLNPACKVLFTVSPIRHTKDGAHGNQLSKAVLLLAVDRLRELFPDAVIYFPSYEIVLDELRDYRFYADDMNHPSALAVDYIWQRFGDAFFDHQTQTIINECQKIQKALTHKPFDKQAEAYRAFLKQIVLKISELEEKYPNLVLEKEKEQCHTLLKL